MATSVRLIKLETSSVLFLCAANLTDFIRTAVAQEDVKALSVTPRYVAQDRPPSTDAESNALLAKHAG
jgi:hypothetical protein